MGPNFIQQILARIAQQRQPSAGTSGGYSPIQGTGRSGPGGITAGTSGGTFMPWRPQQPQLQALWGQSQAGPVGTFGGGTYRPLPGIQADPSQHEQQAISGIMGKSHPAEDAAQQPAPPAQAGQGNWQDQLAKSYQQPQPQAEPAAQQPIQDNALAASPRTDPRTMGRAMGRRAF